VSEDALGGGWAVSPHALCTEIQVLRSEIATSREEEGHLREEILELWTLIAVLDAVLTRHAANNAPSGEEGVRGRRKKKTSPRGDVPNRHRPPMTLSINIPQGRKHQMKMQMRLPLARI
jgi:hypothetical protein